MRRHKINIYNILRRLNIPTLRKTVVRKIAYVSFLLLVFALGFTVWYFTSGLSNENSNVQSESSVKLSASGSVTVTVTRAPRYVHIEVSPMAFPVMGQSWTIFVYSQNSSLDIPVYRATPNATVTITAKNATQTKIYKVNVDEIGRAEFPFLVQYEDIAFQAEYGGNQSETISISKHYESAETVDNLIILGGLLSPISGITGIGTSMTFRNKKIRTAITTLMACMFTVFFVVLSFSVYSKVYLTTIWGYPENINEFISLTLLKNISFFGFILFIIFCVIAATLYLYNFRKGK